LNRVPYPTRRSPDLVAGKPPTSAAHLSQLSDVSTRPNLSIRVLPYKAGFPLGGPVGPYVILEFPTKPGAEADPTVVYIENYTGDLYLEGEHDVEKYRFASARIQRAALDAVSSRNLFRQLRSEEHTSELQSREKLVCRL